MTLVKKQCPYCKGTALVGLTSQNSKICADCKRTHEWTLSEGQAPLFEGTAPDPESCITPEAATLSKL